VVYLKKDEIGAILPRSDRRYGHILKILKKKAGDFLASVCSDGSIGHARIESISPEGLVLSYTAESEAPALRPIRLLMGFPRPIQAARILKDLSSLGLSSVWFALSDLGEKSYAESTFFRKREFECHLIEGAEQAGNPRLPEIRTFWSIDKACQALDETERQDGKSSAKLMFHPDPTFPTIAGLPALTPPVTLAIGSERGWTERELALLRSQGFFCCYLGDRILKTETAATAAASIVLSRLGYM
ncbi:MAG TPA: RsmE family RNA methyltransferase, partial [Rectinemataceae bacterium]|nr:RsmE family RNA methyltransferase [Rectinemataceae bacterium]